MGSIWRCIAAQAGWDSGKICGAVKYFGRWIFESPIRVQVMKPRIYRGFGDNASATGGLFRKMGRKSGADVPYQGLSPARLGFKQRQRALQILLHSRQTA